MRNIIRHPVYYVYLCICVSVGFCSILACQGSSMLLFTSFTHFFFPKCWSEIKQQQRHYQKTVCRFVPSTVCFFFYSPLRVHCSFDVFFESMSHFDFQVLLLCPCERIVKQRPLQLHSVIQFYCASYLVFFFLFCCCVRTFEITYMFVYSIGPLSMRVVFWFDNFHLWTHCWHVTVPCPCRGKKNPILFS